MEILFLRKSSGAFRPEIGAGYCAADLGYDRHVRTEEQEHVDQHENEERDWRDGAEEQEGDFRLTSAETGHCQLRFRLLGSEPFLEREIVDELAHIGLGLHAQRRRLVARRQTLSLASADLLAFAGDRFHALGKRIGIQQRHGDREDRRDDGDRHQQSHNCARIAQLLV